jgi:hypothetical protein
MRGIRLIALAALVALSVCAAARRKAAATAAPAPTSTRAIIARLHASGRAEASFRMRADDPLGGAPLAQPGTLALERDGVRLEFAASGERMTLRGDGGEWLQPEARQLIRLRPEHSASVARIWDLLIGNGTRWFAERALGARRFVLTPRAPVPGESAPDDLPDSVWVNVDARGLPARLELRNGDGGRIRFDVSGWRFARARGRSDFVLSAPPGYADVPLP